MRSIGGFILALIGGIINIILGLSFYRTFYYINKLANVREVEGLSGSIGSLGDLRNLAELLPLSLGIFILAWMIIMGILLIISAFKMKKNDNKSVMFGGIMALITGALSINIFGIIGGIVGIVQAKKVSK